MPLYLSKYAPIVALSIVAALSCGREPDAERNVEGDASQQHSQPAPAKTRPYPPGNRSGPS
jgi:hypothetical protein